MLETICCKRIRPRLLCTRISAVALVIFLSLFIASKVSTAQWRVPIPELKLSQEEAAEYEGKIIIVGAGAAGLYAAYTLEYLGVTNYEILEASSRFGGRVGELTGFVDVPIDLGAEWMHCDTRILQDLILFDTEDELEAVRDIETIKYQPQSYEMLNRYGPIQFNIARYFYREDKFKTTTWYSYFDRFIAPKVKDRIRLNTVVETVNYESPDGKILLTTRDGVEYSCDQVIMAVPSKIMQEEDIDFIPPLPQEKVDAINAVEFGDGMKVFIEFEERFYADVFYALPLTDYIREDPVMYYDGLFRKPTNDHMVTAFDVGFETLMDLTDDEIIEHHLGELDGMYDGKASKYYKQHFVQNWSNEPYIKGAYTLNPIETAEDFGVLSKPVQKKVYFAGEHIDPGEVSTVHGAALSGRRAAQEVLLDALGIE